MHFWKEELMARASTFAILEPLVFLHAPSFPYQRRNHRELTSPNLGPHQLKVKAKSNRSFLEHENAICGLLGQVESLSNSDVLYPAVESSAERLKASILHELQRIDIYKETQWVQQQAKAEGKPIINTGNCSPQY